MFNITESTTEWEGRSLHIQTGYIARQAAGSVVVSYGGTVVSAFVTFCKTENFEEKSNDFGGLALVTNFVAMSYAVGKIPNGFIKREGKASEREVLASRIIDRAVRPMIDQNLVNEVNLTCKLLSYDGDVLPEVPALIAASVALKISGVPFKNTVVGVSLGIDKQNRMIFNSSINSEFILNLFIGCTKNSVIMVESDAHEASEDMMCQAFVDALKSAEQVVEFVEDFTDAVLAKSEKCAPKFLLYDNAKLVQIIQDEFGAKIESIYNQNIKDKESRHAKLRVMQKEIFNVLSERGFEKSEIIYCISEAENALARRKILATEKRLDGRSPDEVRDIQIALDYLCGVHGSAVFTRGGTQSLTVVTLGSHQDEQIVDDFDGERRDSVLLHYNFLPYAVGEVGSLRAPGRREIGHGRLALKAIKNLLPCKRSFSYTVRIVSEITESDGSSSMATVCASSLALMDTGVPIAKHIAGVAMGLVYSKDKYIVLTDISGDEDALGDMDFKVAGTKDGITALQMDIKTDGISIEIIQDALSKALNGRLHILQKMEEVIETSNNSLKESAPKMLSYEIPADSVHKVIGSGGKTIKSLCEENSSKIDIDANNVVHIMSETYEDLMAVQAKINAISGAMPPKVGETYQGKVVSVVDFGLFVRLPTGHDGLVHISEIQKERVQDIYALHNEGDVVNVRVREVARDGKIRLTMRLDEDDTRESDSRPPRRENRSFDNRSSGGGERRSGGSSGGAQRSRSGDDRRSGGGDDRRGGSSAPKRKRFF